MGRQIQFVQTEKGLCAFISVINQTDAALLLTDRFGTHVLPDAECLLGRLVSNNGTLFLTPRECLNRRSDILSEICPPSGAVIQLSLSYQKSADDAAYQIGRIYAGTDATGGHDPEVMRLYHTLKKHIKKEYYCERSAPLSKTDSGADFCANEKNVTKCRSALST